MCSDFSFGHCESSDVKTFGERLKAARLKANLGSRQLSLMVGASKSAVGEWESGRSKTLEMEPFAKLCFALGVSPYWLAFGEEGRSAASVASDSFAEAVAGEVRRWAMGELQGLPDGWNAERALTILDGEWANQKGRVPPTKPRAAESAAGPEPSVSLDDIDDDPRLRGLEIWLAKSKPANETEIRAWAKTKDAALAGPGVVTDANWAKWWKEAWGAHVRPAAKTSPGNVKERSTAKAKLRSDAGIEKPKSR